MIVVFTLLALLFVFEGTALADHNPSNQLMCKSGQFIPDKDNCTISPYNSSAAGQELTEACHEAGEGLATAQERQDARGECVRRLDDSGSISLLTPNDCANDEIFVSVGVGDSGNCIPEGDGSIETNPIITYLRGIIQFLSVGIGIAITIAITVAGIQYSSSRNNPQLVQAASKRLTNAFIALLMFMFMSAILNFLIPGGLF